MRRTRGDDGVTLIELLACLVIMGVVVSALTMSFVASTRSIDQSSFRMADTHDSQMASTLFSSDMQSSNYVWTATPPFPFQSCGSGGSLVTFAWIGSNSGVEQTNVASYQAINQDGEHQLVRQVCSGSGFGTGTAPTSSVVIAHNLYGAPSVACFGPGNTALPSCDGSNVMSAQLTATAQSSATDPTGFQYVLQATRRPTPSASTPPSTPAIVQPTQAIEVGNKAATASVGFGQPNTAGNLIVAYVVWDNSGPVTVTDNNNNTYVAASSVVPWQAGGKSGNVNASAQVFYAANVTGGANTVIASFSDQISSFGLLYVTEYSGIDKTNPLDVTASANGAAPAPMSSGNATTTNANDLLVGLGASQRNVTAPGNLYASVSTFQGNIVEYQIVTTAAAYAATATQDGSSWVMQMVAFRADPGGPPL